jgi:hypothetical protein
MIDCTKQVLSCQLDGAFVCGPVDHPDLLAETMFAEERFGKLIPRLTCSGTIA